MPKLVSNGTTLEIHHLQPFGVAPVLNRGPVHAPQYALPDRGVGVRLGDDARNRLAPSWDSAMPSGL